MVDREKSVESAFCGSSAAPRRGRCAIHSTRIVANLTATATAAAVATTIVAVALAACAPPRLVADDAKPAATTPSPTLEVLPKPSAEVQRTPSDLYQRLNRLAGESIATRRQHFEQVKTAGQIDEWRRARTKTMLDTLGPFPQKCELDAKLVRTIPSDGYRVENVMFQSHPGQRVTGNVYVPDGKGPFPAVIVPCGHSYTGKAADGYQRVSILLAKAGMIAFCYDPIGQGERYQAFDADGKPLGADFKGSPSSLKQLAEVAEHPHFNPVEEHTLIGISSILVGRNTATYRIWDGMRAIDYLVSRPDVDPKRIGCTGNSGGGTLTAYLMALDERIFAAAPTCYLTTFERLLATSGPQDAEQNLFGQLSAGLDQADFVLMRAPKPTILCAGTRDATFDITGTWDIFRESKRIYTRLGYSERIDLAEADEPHGFTKPLREAATRWMSRWLLGKDVPIVEPDLPVRKPEELYCTPKGQVMLVAGELSVFEINSRRAAELAKSRTEQWGAESKRGEWREAVRRVAGIRSGDKLPQAKLKNEAQQVEHLGRRVDKLLLEVDGAHLPALAFFPATPGNEAVVYLHSDGKQIDAGPGGPIARHLEAGRFVLAVDLEGLGETDRRHPRDWGRDLFGANTQEFFLAYLLGRSLTGIRAEQAMAAARVAASHGLTNATRQVRIEAVGVPAGVAALHAAALNEPPFPLALRDSLASWNDVLKNPAGGRNLTVVVQNALSTYDLPDLLRETPKTP